MSQFSKKVRHDYRLRVTTVVKPVDERFVSGTDKILEFSSIQDATIYFTQAHLAWADQREGREPQIA